MKTRNLLHLLLAVLLLALLTTRFQAAPWAMQSLDPGASTPIARAAPQGADWDELDRLPPAIRAKIDPRILAELRGKVLPAHLSPRPEQAIAPEKYQASGKHQAPGKTRFIVYLQAQADLEAARARATVDRQTLVQQRTTVVNTLVETAQTTQAPVKALLNAHMAAGDTVSYLPYYIVNGLAVEGNLSTVIALAKRKDVQRIAANYRLVKFEGSGAAPFFCAPSAWAPNGETGGLDPANWNIDLVDAERVWNELGIDGRGAVVADFDTGVDWDHPALRDQYRGWDGAAAHHDYNWFEFDAMTPAYWDVNGNYGPSASTAPFDCSDHGTHTMGTMIGDGGTSTTQIGVAPGARWMAVPGICGRTMPDGYADDIGGIRTFQWLLCPTDLSGDLSTRDCSKAPDVVNNSWGSSNPADDTFRPVVQALRAAGIAPVFASGNPSAGWGSIGSPGSIPEAIAVGATDRYDVVTSFSGRGPSFYEGVQKPELTAPGQSVRSSVPGGGYESLSGTSMAAPHVSGLVALMISADLRDGRRDLDVDELLAFMEYSAVDLGPSGPDDAYGYGRIDAYRAVRWVLGAGDVRGAVRDKTTSATVSGANITGVAIPSGDRFATRADAGGVYSATVPGGVYDVRVEAFGYAGQTFAGVNVLTGTHTLVDFGLTPLPTHLLTGRVYGDALSPETTPVSGARVYVDAVGPNPPDPDLAYTTGADGAYALRLPLGVHDITVEAAGYRVGHATVAIDQADVSEDITLVAAPSILLVEADGYLGWFTGRPARNFFRYALDARDFLYDTYVVADPSFPPDLSPYDIVIWAHTLGSPGFSGFQTVSALTGYLDAGGRLILSGQDIGYWDSYSHGQPYYQEYLHASFQMDSAANSGDTVSGSRFLGGLDLTLNEAALYNAPNTSLDLSPDGVAPADGNAYSILTYDNGQGAAALAIDPCDRPFRAVYMAIGYETLGPRAYSRPPEYVDLLERSIEWITQTKPQYDVELTITPAEWVGSPNTTVQYDLILANTGRTLDEYDLVLSGNHWSTRMYDGPNEVSLPINLPPCTHLALTLQVGIPSAAEAGATDSFEIVAASRTRPDVDARVQATTTAFSRWQTETPMPTPRYRLAAAALPGDSYYYALGGLGGDSWGEAQEANERYNTCTGQWDTLAPMPTPRGNLSAAVIDRKIYVPGGFRFDASSDEEYLDVLEIYDPASDSWTSGAAMPEPLSGIAVAAHGGKLYVFGGNAPGQGLSDKTFVYDPKTDHWKEKAPLPGGPRGFAAAAALNAKIYVVGGWYVNTVEVYDPATDTWSTAAPMHVARQSPGLAAAPDGRLYVSGGGTDNWAGLASTERYDPTLDTWQMLFPLNDGNRAGSASAYAGGYIYAIGGIDYELSDANESMPLFGQFCRSTKHTPQDTVYPFMSTLPAPESLSQPFFPGAPNPVYDIEPTTRISYTITLYSGDDATSEEASVIDPIPPGTAFGAFGDNTAGATYNADLERIEWSGVLPPNSPPLSLAFGLDVDLTQWHSGDTVVNRAIFSRGGAVFARTASVQLDFPDPSPSAKTVDKTWARAGDRLTYTLHIETASTIADVLTVSDPIPAHTTYIPGSLTYSAGAGIYDDQAQAILWAGLLPDLVVYKTSAYAWGDSEGRGTVPDVTPDWHDMTGATDTGVSADDGTYGAFPIGFPFDFWGVSHDEFHVSPNGWVGFSAEAGSIVSCDDYGDPATPNNFIGGFGGDRAVYSSDGGSIAYKLFGSAPDRRLVVQFTNMRYWYHSAGDTLDMQIVLYETSQDILVQYRDLTTSPTLAAVGLEGPAPDFLHQLYKDSCQTSIRGGLAIRYQPRLLPSMGNSADVSYAVAVDESLPLQTWITNTATVSSTILTVQRQAGTLIDPVDLSHSHKAASAEVTNWHEISYTLLLRNTGLQPVHQGTLTDPIPPHTAYVPGSLACSSGACQMDAPGQAVRWSGVIAPSSTVTLSFRVALVEFLADRTPITNTAILTDEYGNRHELQAITLVRASDLSHSFNQVTPARVDPGEMVTCTIHVHNSSDVDTTAELHDMLPAELTYVPGSLSCGIGTCQYNAGAITWAGAMRRQSMVPIRFQATVADDARPGVIQNRATVVNQATGQSHPIAAALYLPRVPWRTYYMPMVYKVGR